MEEAFEDNDSGDVAIVDIFVTLKDGSGNIVAVSQTDSKCRGVSVVVSDSCLN